MEQYTLPIMRYTNEIWDILYPEASKYEWNWMNNVHSSADAAIIQMHMARQSAHYPKKLGKVQFVVIDQEFFQWIGMTIHEWGQLSLGKKAKDMQKYFHQLMEPDMQRLLEKNHMDQDHRMYVYRFRTENMLPNLCELPTDLKELLTDCLKLRVDGKLLYLPGICFSKDFHGLEFTPSELYRDFQEMAEIYFATGASVRKGKYRVDQKREVRKASGQELQIPFVVAHEAKASMNVEELFESPFHSNVFPEELHTALKETFGEIHPPSDYTHFGLAMFHEVSICRKLTYINNISHRSGSDLKKSYVPLGQQIIGGAYPHDQNRCSSIV